MSYIDADDDHRSKLYVIGGLVAACLLAFYLLVGFGASVSKEEYARLQDGMTYDQVVTLVGGEGSLVMDVGTMGMQMRTYQWSGPSMGTEVILSFDGNRLSGKMLVQ